MNREVDYTIIKDSPVEVLINSNVIGETTHVELKLVNCQCILLDSDFSQKTSRGNILHLFYPSNEENTNIQIYGIVTADKVSYQFLVRLPRHRPITARKISPDSLIDLIVLGQTVELTEMFIAILAVKGDSDPLFFLDLTTESPCSVPIKIHQSLGTTKNLKWGTTFLCFIYDTSTLDNESFDKIRQIADPGKKFMVDNRLNSFLSMFLIVIL